MIAKDFLEQKVCAEIDRPLGSRHPQHGFLWLLNYGYITGTLEPDGEAIDACVLGVYEALTHFEGRCVAVVHRLDDQDDKLILVPDGKHYSDEQILALTEFQERFFKSVILRKAY